MGLGSDLLMIGAIEPFVIAAMRPLHDRRN